MFSDTVIGRADGARLHPSGRGAPRVHAARSAGSSTGSFLGNPSEEEFQI
jgi:hypothetical protein